jgi:hypothetical protein
MKRLMWGAVLFLIAAAGGNAQLEACDWKAMLPATQATTVFHQGGSTVVISSDDDFVTIVVYSDTEPDSEWM